MSNLKRRLFNRHRGEEGQTLAEYTLILAFVAVVSVTAVTALGVTILTMFEGVLPGFG